jgi:hypothetical protein
MGIKTQRTYSFDIQQNGTIRRDIEIQSNVKAITGLQISSNRDDLIYQRGSMGLTISNIEITPDNTPDRLFMSGIGVPPNQKPYSIGKFLMDGTNRQLRISLTDEDVVGTDWADHKLKLTLDVELE